MRIRKVHLLIDLGIKNSGAVFSTDAALHHVIMVQAWLGIGTMRIARKGVVCLLVVFVTDMLQKERFEAHTATLLGTFEVLGARWKAKITYK